MPDDTTAPVTAEDGEGRCQHPTRLDAYGLPASTCGAPAVEHRPDRMFVRFVCGDHRDTEDIVPSETTAYTLLLDELDDTGEAGSC